MAKRMLATLVCVMMVLAMVSGCSTTPEATTATPEATTATPEATASAPVIVEKKELTISWGGGMSDPNADDFGKWMQSNFKVKLNVVAINDAAKLQLLAASDTLPDIIGGMGFGDAAFNQLKAEGMIRDIPEDMLTKFPVLKKTIDEHPLLSGYKKSDPKNYWLPTYGNADKPAMAQHSPFYYRADWAKTLNITTPVTVDDYYNMLKRFTFEDPDGNKANDTYGITGWLWQVHFMPWVDMYAWIKEDGKWIPGYLSKNMLPALQFYNKLYKEKILDPEFANANGKSMFYTDKVGVMGMSSTTFWIWKDIYQGFTGAHEGMTVEQGLEAVQFLPPLKADANSPARWPQQLDGWGVAIGAKCDDEKLERILEIANWELTPEGRDFMTYGFAGKDWLITNGKAVSILPNNPVTGSQKSLSQIYPCNEGWIICEGYDVPGTPWLNPPIPQECYDRSAQFEVMAAPAVVKSNYAIDFLYTPLRDKMSLSLDGVESDYNGLITSANIDVDYANLIKSYMETQGLQAVIDEMNAAIIADGLDK